MSGIGNLKKLFELLDEIQKTYPTFNAEEKQVFCRMAFYKETFEETQKAVLHAAGLNPEDRGRKQLLVKYAEGLPEFSNGDAAQLEQYIFQLQQMCYEQDKAMDILEDILKLNGISQGHNAISAKPEETGISESGRSMEESGAEKSRGNSEGAGIAKNRRGNDEPSTVKSRGNGAEAGIVKNRRDKDKAMTAKSRIVRKENGRQR